MKNNYPINMNIPVARLQMASNDCTTFQKNPCTILVPQTGHMDSVKSTPTPDFVCGGRGYNDLSAVLIIYDYQFLKVCTEQNTVVILIPIKNTNYYEENIWILKHLFSITLVNDH